MSAFSKAIAFALVLISPQIGFARCPDGNWWSVEREFSASRYVVIARVISEWEDPEGEGEWIAGTFYRLDVRQSFRGSPKSHIDLFSENSSGRFPMEKGAQYLIFVSTCESRQYAYAKGNSIELSKAGGTLAKVKNLSNGNR